MSPFKVVQCAVCRRDFHEDDPRIHRQYGGVGKWWSCQTCIDQEDERREQKGRQRFEAPMKQGRQRIPAGALQLWEEEADE